MKVNLLLIFTMILLMSCKKGLVQRPYLKGKYAVVNNGEPADNTNTLLKRMDDVYKSNPELVILMIGTNDAGRLTLDQYTANLDSIVLLLKARNARVLLLSPPPHGTAEIVYPDAKNEKIEAEVKAMYNISLKDSCQYLDINAAFKAQGTPNTTSSSLIRNPANTPSNPDGVHPTSAGYRFIASQVYDFMKSNNLTRFTKISCFGDSITYGPYPGLLVQLLNGNSI